MKAAKAIFATITTFLTGLITVVVDDANIGDVTQGQWLAIILATLVAGGGVYGLPNKPS